jgi:hypothetical protein
MNCVAVKILIIKVFGCMLKSYCFKFLLVQRMALKFRSLWLNNKKDIHYFESLQNFKVVKVSNLIF